MECIGCTERITRLALLECGHSSACPLCIFRLRSLLHDSRCPECRHSSEMVFIADGGTYETYAAGFWGDRHMSGFKEFEQTKIYCQTEEMKGELAALVQNACQICGLVLKSLTQLLGHLEKEHRLHMCDLCVSNKTVFVTEQELYTSEDLVLHKEGGDNESPGHPRCRLCSRFLYDDKALLQHIREQHYFCDLCPAESRPAFSNYDSLERHYDKAHFLCTISTCRRSKHVVFSTWDELIAHHRTYHRGSELPVLKPSFLGAGEEYVPRVTEAPTKRPGVPLTEEQKQEEFPALCAVAPTNHSVWGEGESNPLKQLVRQKQRIKRTTPTVLVNPLTFEQVKAKPEETKAWSTPLQPSQPAPKPAAPQPKPAKPVLTPKDFPSLSTQEVPMIKAEITVESQVALLNRKQISKEGFIEWFIENVRREKRSELYTAIYNGLSDRRLAQAVVAGIEGRTGSGEALWDSDFPALAQATPVKQKKQREKKQKQGSIPLSAWVNAVPARSEPAPLPIADFPSLPTPKEETEDFPGLPVSAPKPAPQAKPSPQSKKLPEEAKEEPSYCRTIRDNLALLASGAVSQDEFVHAYIQIVPHAQQLSSRLLTILKAAGAQPVINELWARVDKSAPARTAILDQYKEDLDRLIHMYRYGFSSKEKFVEDYSALVEQKDWLDRELIRYISVSVPGEALIEAIEQRNRDRESYTDSLFPNLQPAKGRRKAK